MFMTGKTGKAHRPRQVSAAFLFSVLLSRSSILKTTPNNQNRVL
jgi:hypothetical protein